MRNAVSLFSLIHDKPEHTLSNASISAQYISVQTGNAKPSEAETRLLLPFQATWTSWAPPMATTRWPSTATLTARATLRGSSCTTLPISC
eukprot:4211831-Pleurochrysis_carterae.AAC.4